jgi:hypothetical protein
LLDVLPSEQRTAVAYEALNLIADDRHFDSSDLLSKLGPFLGENGHSRALDIVANSGRRESRNEMLSAIASTLPPALLSRAIELARRIGDENEVISAAVALVAGLDGDDLNQLITWVAEVQSDYVRARAVADIIPHLPDGLVDRAQDIVEDIKDPESAAVALPALAQRLVGTERNATLRQAISLAATIDDPDSSGHLNLWLRCSCRRI